MTTNDICDIRIANAKRASEALRCATVDRDPAIETMTTVGSLVGLKTVIEDLEASLTLERTRSERLLKALQRINGLQVRSGRDAVERRDWKQMTFELQAVAEGALLMTSVGA